MKNENEKDNEKELEDKLEELKVKNEAMYCERQTKNRLENVEDDKEDVSFMTGFNIL